MHTRCLLGGLLLFAATPIVAAAERNDSQQWEAVLDQILTRAEMQRSTRSEAAGSSSAEVHERVIASSSTTVAHSLVGDFVRYFSRAGAKHFQISQKRLEKYRAMIEEVLDQEGLPRNLMWVGLVESGYNPLARSPKNAVGIWQFIPETAETFGLRVNGADERTDPLKSTRAAARYLKFLYAKFRDWPLVLAAYNAGERRVLNGLERSGAVDFWQLAESGLLPRETLAYVPAVLAAQSIGEGHLGKRTPTSDPVRTSTRVVFATFDVSR